MSGEAWGFVFLMLALKIPIVYLGVVVWYAIKAEPEPGATSSRTLDLAAVEGPETPRPRRGGPHGSRDSVREQRARRDRVQS